MRDRLVKIDRVYADIPPVPCLPDCAQCCGPILMTRAEWDRITRKIGHEPKGQRHLYLAEKNGSCSLLDGNRCSVYDIRPLVCRLYAAGPQAMRCPHGCQSEWLLSETECDGKMRQLFRLGA